jgi:transposase
MDTLQKLGDSLMNHYAGLDISLGKAAICIVDETGGVVREMVVASDPAIIADALHDAAASFRRVGLEAGPMAPWLNAGLADLGLPAICIEVRQMRAFAKASPIKTDKRDARLIAQAMRTGLFKATHVKTDASQRLRLLLRHRQSMMRRNRDLLNTIRGTLKAFGYRIGVGKSSLFTNRVRETLTDAELLNMTEPLLKAYEHGLAILADLDAQLLAAARADRICCLLMTVPGVGAMTALAFRTGVDIASRFEKSQTVGAIFGLTPRIYASGEVEHVGRITKCGDGLVRWLLYEAANSILTRCKGQNWLKDWALNVARRRGMRKARVALARRLSVVMHRMWVNHTPFSALKLA